MYSVVLTLREAAEILQPRVTEQQLRDLVRAVGLQPVGREISGRPGHPRETYDADEIMRVHGAVAQFLKG